MSSRIDPWFWMRALPGWKVAVEECNLACDLQDITDQIAALGVAVVVTFPDYRDR